MKISDLYYAKMRPGFPAPPQIPLPVCPRSAGRTALAPGHSEETPAGKKDFIQLTWVSGGSGTMTCGGTEESVEPGCVVIQRRNERRRNVSSVAGLSLRWLTFDGPDADRFLESYAYPSLIRDAGDCPDEFFGRYERALVSGTPGDLRRAVAALTGILALAGDPLNPPTQRHPLVEAFIDEAERLYVDPSVDINTLCGLLNTSRTTLSRIFRAAGAGSPGEYLRNVRIRHAIELLASGKHPIAETAGLCGFWNASHFTQTVKRITGFTPGKLKTRM